MDLKRPLPTYKTPQKKYAMKVVSECLLCHVGSKWLCSKSICCRSRFRCWRKRILDNNIIPWEGHILTEIAPEFGPENHLDFCLRVGGGGNLISDPHTEKVTLLNGEGGLKAFSVGHFAAA